MPEYKPLTKEARELACDAARHFVGDWMPGPFDANTILRYEATVAALEAENEALRCHLSCAEDDATFCNAKRNEAETELARLRPLAEVGEAVEAMPVGWRVARYLHGFGAGPEDADDVLGAGTTALAALRMARLDAALAALRTAKGEDDA